MKKGIYILYKNGHEDIYEEKDLDSRIYTLRGHANQIIDIWMKSKSSVYQFDHYNAVLLDEVISIRVIQ